MQTRHATPSLSQDTWNDEQTKKTDVETSHLPAVSGSFQGEVQNAATVYGRYGCICCDCLWKRFLLVIDTLVLLGFISEPRRTKKSRSEFSSVEAENYVGNVHEEEDATLRCSEASQRTCVGDAHPCPEFERYRSLLKDVYCRQLYTPGSEMGIL